MRLIFNFSEVVLRNLISSTDEDSKGDAYQRGIKTTSAEVQHVHMVGGEQDTPPYHDIESEFHSQ